MQKGKNGKDDVEDVVSVTKESIERALINRKIANLKKQQDDFRIYAEKQMSALEGGIQALKELLEPEPVKPDPAANPVPEAIPEIIPEDLPKPE